MRTPQTTETKGSADMHWMDIRAALAKQGLTLTAASLAAGLPEYACRHALINKNRSGEEAIAAALGLPVEKIWPSRFPRPRRFLKRFKAAASSCLRQK